MKKNSRLLCLILVILSAFLSIGYAATNENKALNNVKPFTVAVVQFNPELNERDKNIDALLKIVTEAAENGAKLIVTPEMATTGYYYKDREAIGPFVDTIPGKTTEKFEKIAKKYGVYIVIGMPEVDSKTDIYYNSAALVGSEGYIGKYRKVHQWETEEHWAAWGDLGVPVFDTKIGKIAINICMDSCYFESARLAALNGADILAFSTNSSGGAVAHLQARAVQNGLYVISANRSNTENGFHMIGVSAIWAPDGEKLVESEFTPKDKDLDEPTIIYAEIDPAKYNNAAKKRLLERRPELYKDLMLYIAPWDYTKNTTSNDVKAAALQYEPIVGNKNANMNKIKELINECVQKEKDRNIDLFVLPELSVTGPVFNKSTAKEMAEDLSGETVKAFKELAKANGAYIVFGMIEKENDQLYNSAVLVDPNGEIVGTYRKTHLHANDQLWAEPGDKIEVFSTEIGKIGMMMGYESAFPEVAGVMTVKRADIIAMPSCANGSFDREIKINKEVFTNQYPDGSMCLWDSVALSAQAYTIVSNFIGTDYEFFGRSALYTLDPVYGLDQPVVASQDKETALIAEFSTLKNDWWFNQEKLILSRRTHLYKPLIQ